MKTKKFLKEFWKENKKEYRWACIILTIATIFLYDLMFLSMTNQPPITLMEYIIWMPVMYSGVGFMALGTEIFIGWGKLR